MHPQPPEIYTLSLHDALPISARLPTPALAILTGILEFGLVLLMCLEPHPRQETQPFILQTYQQTRCQPPWPSLITTPLDDQRLLSLWREIWAGRLSLRACINL